LKVPAEIFFVSSCLRGEMLFLEWLK